ncbi:O-antigen ligase family protein [Pirellulaceae bacterium SH449]
MEFVALLMGIALLGWAVFFVRFHSVPAGAIVFLIATSVFPPEYLSFGVPGMTLTLDRIWLGAIVVQFLVDWLNGRIKFRSLTGSDLLLMGFMIWLFARTITTPIGQEIPGQPSTMMHLINGYLCPLFLYMLLRHVDLKVEMLWPAVSLVLLFGVYLSITAVLEVSKQWSFVFPPFIADPTLGIHFGRARGPMLQSVRLGMCLNFALAILWTFPLWLNYRKKWAWILVLSLTPLFLLAILLTYTRSIWMGTAAIVVILMLTMLKGKSRTLALGSLIVSGAMAGLIIGPNLVAFKREYTEAETLESTRMRGAFAYVSYQMILDKPIAGFGFNQFQVYNRPYLDDRTTNIRLESIRGYVHHNSYLSLLVDLGLVGGVLFLAATIAFLRTAWTLWSHPLASSYYKSGSVLFFCVAAVHAIQMAFHEVSFSSIEYTMLFFVAAVCQVCRDKLIAETETYRSLDVDDAQKESLWDDSEERSRGSERKPLCGAQLLTRGVARPQP